MISVCIPTYNGGKFIRQQLGSILSQLSNDDEIIISDDSSTDNTLEIINSFNDKRIKVLENNTFHSPIYNLENALKQAGGDYIFLSDQDDEWMLNKISVVMEHLKSANLVVHDAQVVDGEGKQLYKSLFFFFFIAFIRFCANFLPFFFKDATSSIVNLYISAILDISFLSISSPIIASPRPSISIASFDAK